MMIDMDYWTEHHYAGHIFLIKSDEPPSKWDGYCQYILQYRTIFGTSWSPDTVEPVQPPTDAVRFSNTAASGRGKSERASEPKNLNNDPSPKAPKQKPLGALSVALAGTCVVCGLPIQRSGKRGRPRTRHVECR